MSSDYRTIAVHVNESRHTLSRIGLAAKLAIRFEAHLIGDPRRNSIEHAGSDEQLLPREARAKIRSLPFGHAAPSMYSWAA